MILDQLAQWRKYAGMSPLFSTAFAYLEAVTEQSPEGRNEIAGDDVFAIVVKTRTTPIEGRQMEVHRRYIDIHYVLRGGEMMLWSPLAALTDIKMEFDPEQDAALYAAPAAVRRFAVRPGEFALFLPEDGHAPSCTDGDPAEVVKAVVKVRV